MERFRADKRSMVSLWVIVVFALLTILAPVVNHLGIIDPYTFHQDQLNPLTMPNEPEGIETASGESYDPETWSAAIQTDLRGAFGGVRYGRNYRPSFALVECGAKRAIVKINDVGPLAPGRIIDLNTRTMRYFDPTLALGLVRDVVVTPLPGDDWIAGPVDGEDNRMLAMSAR